MNSFYWQNIFKMKLLKKKSSKFKCRIIILVFTRSIAICLYGIGILWDLANKESSAKKLGLLNREYQINIQWEDNKLTAWNDANYTNSKFETYNLTFNIWNFNIMIAKRFHRFATQKLLFHFRLNATNKKHQKVCILSYVYIKRFIKRKGIRQSCGWE